MRTRLLVQPPRPTETGLPLSREIQMPMSLRLAAATVGIWQRPSRPVGSAPLTLLRQSPPEEVAWPTQGAGRQPPSPLGAVAQLTHKVRRHRRFYRILEQLHAVAQRTEVAHLLLDVRTLNLSRSLLAAFAPSTPNTLPARILMCRPTKKKDRKPRLPNVWRILGKPSNLIFQNQ